MLNKYQVSILFYNYYGNYIGRYTPKEFINGKVLLHQVECHTIESKRSKIVREMLYTSFYNMLSLLKYYNKKNYDLNSIIEDLTALQTTLNDIPIEQMLLVEARFKQTYYQAFDVILQKDIYQFEARSKRPPKNEVNAMMGFGYSLLYTQILAILDRSSLHPQISFIHSLSKTCDSLQFDLADSMKPVIIDRLIFRLIHRNQLNETHFMFKDDACHLSKEGIIFFTTQFNEVLAKTIHYKSRYYSYKGLLSHDVHCLSNYIKGDKNQLDFFRMQW